jgi:hypothetical protein
VQLRCGNEETLYEAGGANCERRDQGFGKLSESTLSIAAIQVLKRTGKRQKNA